MTPLSVLLMAAQIISAQDAIAASGRCAHLVASPSERVAPQPAISPGPPPLLSFRYYEGRLRHRYGNMDLVLDDAGH